MESGLDPDYLERSDGKTLATVQALVVERRKRLSWQNSEELLASIFELLSATRREQLIVGGVPFDKAPDVIHFPRPGERPAEATAPKATSARSVAQRLMRK